MMKTILQLTLLSGFALVSTLLFTGCPTDVNDPVDPDGPIGVYNGTGAYPEFATAIASAIDSLGREFEFFDEVDAQEGPEEFSMLIFSGGNPLQMAAALGVTGREKIQAHVYDGAGFLGIGGGAYLAADTMVYDGIGSIGNPPIGLFDGRADGPIQTLAPDNSNVMALVEITNNTFDPEFIEDIESLYRSGPEWQIGSPVYTEIAKFIQTGGSSGVIFSAGYGRIVLLAFHPEIEENDPRDGTTYADELDDPDSEWFLIRTITEWCLHEI